MSDKARLQIQAKDINANEMMKTFFLLLVCLFVPIFMANVRVLYEMIPAWAGSPDFFKDYPWIAMLVSFLLIMISLPLMANLKALQETWFIFRAKTEGQVNFKAVRMAVKKIGLKKKIWLYILSIIRNLSWCITLLLPSILLFQYWTEKMQEGSLSLPVICIFAGFNLGLALIAGMSFFSLRQKYSLRYWVLLDRPDLSAKQALAESARIMDNKCIDLLSFKLRFTAWFLLCVFVVPAIYIYAYYKQACAVYAYELMMQRNTLDDKTVTFQRIKRGIL